MLRMLPHYVISREEINYKNIENFLTLIQGRRWGWVCNMKLPVFYMLLCAHEVVKSSWVALFNFSLKKFSP